ncbi:MAG: S41 family peptidase [Anaerolineales bacterium]
MTLTRKLLIAGVLLSAFVAACGGEATPIRPIPFPTTIPAERQLHAFDTFWEGIQDRYLYLELNDINLATLGGTSRRRIEGGLTDEEFEALMEEVTASFPASSMTYRTRAERIENDLANTVTYEGIGAFVSYFEEPDPHVVLLAVMADSPAERAGLAAHESITGVDGIAISPEEGADVVQRVRGPSGTSVRLNVRAPDGAVREVEVVRGRLTANDQLSLRYFPATGTGYFLLPVAAGEELSDLLSRGFERLGEETLNSLILDLRVAHSSASWPLGAMLSLFGDGPMGAIYSRTEESPLIVEGRDTLNSQAIPLVILVGPDTQGASEIFAAAMQSNGRAVVVGQNSPGSVVNFDQITLPDGSQVFYAVSSYQTPDGRDLSLSGVVPDVIVAAGWDEVSLENDPVLERALELLAGFG